MPETLVLRQFAYLDFEEDLDAIAEAAREAGPDLEIVVERVDPSDPHVRGVSGRAILEVVASSAGSYTFGKVADAIIAKARTSWKARHLPHHWPRTHIVKILGPNGGVLREVKVSDDRHRRPRRSAGRARRRARAGCHQYPSLDLRLGPWTGLLD